MTFSGDHLEPKSPWSKARSYTVLSLIIFGFVALIADNKSRGYALMAAVIIVTVMCHEAGHFIAAKWAKMKATEFFVGFGPRIWSFRRGETEYGIKALPLGGYVKIIGMTNLEEVDTADEHRTYRKGQTRKKLVVILAGVTVNFILAYVLIFASLVGQGTSVSTSTKIDTVQPGSASERVGLHHGDIIKKIDGTKTPTFDAIKNEISRHKVHEEISVTYIHKSKTFTHSVKLDAALSETGKVTKNPFLGVSPAQEYKRVAVVPALRQAGIAEYRVVKLTVTGMGRIFSPSGISKYSKTVVNGNYKSQTRPSSLVGIVNIGGNYVNQDIWYLLWMMALINVMLGFINVLPILPLDGGHAAVAIYERIASRITGREIHADYKKLMPIITVVAGILLIFILSSLYLDVLQIAS